MNRVLHECAANLHIWIDYDVVDDAPLATGHGATTEAAPLRANARAALLHAHGNEPPH